ncbi:MULTISPECIES: TOTE conflict system archaeo-eukaryotic primase domain-containing protein [unclassified Phyllobacterium]|uniref:TOTE conflict system archaeo-eukaryotic primase domain-containing protein n=1 Tax=unclassified Phyllobacterium TaxID=2638441 RepID=UPI003013024B
MDAQLKSPGEKYAQQMYEAFPGPTERSLTYDLVKYDKLKAERPDEKITLREHNLGKDIKHGATVDDWQQHLDRERPLGMSPVMDDGTCLWGCIDVDEYGSDRRFELLNRIKIAKLPLVMCESKSGGAHLFLFLSEPAPAGEVHKSLRAFAEKLGISKPDLFPSNPDGDIGNQLNMPFLGDDRPYIDHNGLPKTIPEFLERIARGKVTPEAMRKAARIANNSQTAEAENAAVAEPPAGTLTDAMQRLALWQARFAGTAPFELRYVHANSILAAAAFDLARYVRDCDLPEADAQGSMRKAWLTRKADEGGDEATFDDIWPRQFAKGLAKGSPVRVPSGAMLPYIERVQVDRDEKGKKLWLIQIEGKTVQATTAELADWKKFNECCIEYVGKRIPFIRSKEVWGRYTDRAYAIAEEIPQEHIYSEDEQFREQLEVFVMDRHRALDRDEIHLGKPWEDEDHGIHVFLMQALERHLRQSGSKFAMESRTALGKRIRKLDGDAKNMRLKGKIVNVFFVPSKHFKATPEMPLPPVDRDAI